MITEWQFQLTPGRDVNLFMSFLSLRYVIFPCILILESMLCPGYSVLEKEVLTPYVNHHGPLHRSHRDTQACQSVKYGKVTHSKVKAFNPDYVFLPLVETHRIMYEVGDYWNKRIVYASHQIVNNPLRTWSVLEPGEPGSCRNDSSDLTPVQVTAKQKQCLVATNGGFFNTHTGQCLGNIVTDAFLVQDSGGTQNVHFGITEDGFIYTGYLSELDLVAQRFTQLIGGVVWLIRSNESYVDESISIECPDTEETGSIQRFVNVVSARTAVGHDAEGKIHMVQVNGKTDDLGVNLYEFTNLLLQLGITNAINLDGGGSTTTVLNGTVANYPSDKCDDNGMHICTRNVATVLCAHEPECSPADCSLHGVCEMGVCQCEKNWAGNACDTLRCPQDCNRHGTCTEDGCQCDPGWYGLNCSLPCNKGWYGSNCSNPCVCANTENCDAVSGQCFCQSGYTGQYCEKKCPFGLFGLDCTNSCDCQDSCFCDHVTGDCKVSPDLQFALAGHCLAQTEIKEKHLVPDKYQLYSTCLISVICLTVIIIGSLLLNATLTYLLFTQHRRHRLYMSKKIRAVKKEAYQKYNAWQCDSTSSADQENSYLKTKFLMEEEAGERTGSGEEEDDLFLTPLKNEKKRHS